MKLKNAGFLCFTYFAQLLISTIYISDNLVFPAGSPSNVILKMWVKKKIKPKPITMQNCGTKSQLTHPTHNSCYQGSGIIEEEEVEKIWRVKGTGSSLGDCVSWQHQKLHPQVSPPWRPKHELNQEVTNTPTNVKGKGMHQVPPWRINYRQLRNAARWGNNLLQRRTYQQVGYPVPNGQPLKHTHK